MEEYFEEDFQSFRQKEAFQQDDAQIRQERRRSLRAIAVYMAVVMGFVAALTALPMLAPIRIGTVMCEVMLLLLLILSREAETARLITFYVYLICSVVLVWATYLSFCQPANAYSTAYLVLTAILPVVIFDLTQRKSVYFFILLGLHVAAMAFVKTPGAVLADLGIGVAATSAALYAGHSSQSGFLRFLDLFRTANEQLRRDYLTGLYNRYYLPTALKNASLGNRTIRAMYMLDIDKFKEYNDMYGHAAGDKVLKAVSNTCQQCARTRRVDFFRYGGEEFLGIDFEEHGDPAAFAQQLRRAVEECRIPHRGSPVGYLTVSIGFTVDNSEYEKMIDHADAALYHAKSTGRMRVVSYEDMVARMNGADRPVEEPPAADP